MDSSPAAQSKRFNFKVCYVLTSGECSSYADSTLISAALLRSVYPGIHIELLADTESLSQIKSTSSQLLDSVDHLHLLDTPRESPVMRSRFLKTQAREIIGGDFVFIDSDAIVIREFDQPWGEQFDFAAVLDRNCMQPYPHFPDWAIPIYRKLKWQFPAEYYFNSGVVFWKDSLAARELSRRWHQNWRQQVKQTGVHQDQPALNHTIRELEPSIKVLDVSYNALIDASPWFARKARILHYTISKGEPARGTLLGHLIHFWRETGRINWAAVDTARRLETAWVDPPEDLNVLLATRRYQQALTFSLRRAWTLLRNPSELGRRLVAGKLARVDKGR